MNVYTSVMIQERSQVVGERRIRAICWGARPDGKIEMLTKS